MTRSENMFVNLLKETCTENADKYIFLISVKVFSWLLLFSAEKAQTFPPLPFVLICIHPSYSIHPFRTGVFFPVSDKWTSVKQNRDGFITERDRKRSSLIN